MEHTIGKILENNAKKYPDKEFIVYPLHNIKWTYKDFNEWTDRIAAGLLKSGLKCGDRLGIWAINIPEWLSIYFAALKIGLTIISIDANYKINEVSTIIKQLKINAICFADQYQDINYYQILQKLIPDLEYAIDGTVKTKKFPHLNKIIYMKETQKKGCISFNILLNNFCLDMLDQAKNLVKPENNALLIQTSGTSGKSKTIAINHRNIILSAYSSGLATSSKFNDRLIMPLPLSHIFAQFAGIIRTIIFSSTIILLDDFNPISLLTCINISKPSCIHAVPSLLQICYNVDNFSSYNINSIKKISIGGDKISNQLIYNIFSNTQAQSVMCGYGMTETCGTVAVKCVDIKQKDDIKFSDISYKPIPIFDIKIIDKENYNVTKNQQIGEICIKGQTVIAKYANNRNILDEEGFFHTGDFGFINKEGLLNITGRKKNVIIKGGANINPEEITAILMNHPYIKEAAVIGVPDKKYGETICAFVILKSSKLKIKDYEIINWCKHKISKNKIPTHLFFINKIPLNRNMKIQNSELRKQAIELINKKKD